MFSSLINDLILIINSSKEEDNSSNIFKLDNSVFKQKNFTFDYVINTDCYTASIKMLNKNKILLPALNSPRVGILSLRVKIPSTQSEATI